MKDKELEIALNDDNTISFSDYINIRIAYETVYQEKDKEIKRLNKRINELEDKLEKQRNNEWEKLAMKAARSGIPSSQLLDNQKMMKKYIPLFVVKSKVTGHEYNVYETKTKKSGMEFYKIYNYFTDKFEWLFYDIFEKVGEKE